MKKKIIKIAASSLGVIVVSALLAAGIFMLVRNKNVEETGNVLGVSWYNETEEEFEITTAEQLNELAALSKFYTFEDQTIKLSADIVMNEGNAEEWGEKAPKERWKPIEQFAGVFDGQGHTISGLYGKVYEAPMALFAKTDSVASVQNLSLVNSYFETGGSAGAASFAVIGDGKFVKLYSDAIIVNRGDNGGGIVTRVTMNANFEECWYDGTITQNGRWLGGIVGAIDSGRAIMKHCLFSGDISTEQEIISYAATDGVRTGALCGVVNKNGTLMVEDTLASGTMSIKHNTYAGTVVGAIFDGASGNMTDVYTTQKITGINLIGAGSGRSSTPPAYMEQEQMLGVKAYQWSTLDFDNYWAVVEGDTPILKHFAKEVPSLAGVEKAYDISWYSPTAYDVTITNLKELYGLAVLSKTKTFENYVIKLGADIVVNEGKATTWMSNPDKAPANPWFPISSKECRFAGTFDGQGYAISGIYYNAHGEVATDIGLFSYTQAGSTIRNLNILNSYYDVSGNPDQRFVGSVAGHCLGSLDTIYSDIIIKADGRDIGGIAGYLDFSGATTYFQPVVNNCWFNGKLIGDTGRRMGGITGAVFGVADNVPTYSITNCLSTGYISNNRKDSKDGLGGQYIGGILGQEANPANVILKDCLSAGQIDVEYATYVGSVMGRLSNKDSTLTLDGVYATQEVYKRYIHEAVGTQNGAAIMLPESIITGVNGYKWTTLDFNKYWAVAKDDTPVLQSFISAAKVPTTSVAKEKRMVDIKWYNASKKEFTIDTLEELYGFWLLSNSTTFEGQTVKLGADIAVNAADEATIAAWKAGTATATNPWFAIGQKDMRFKGTFDGQMHKISGIYLDTTLRNQHLGVFGYTELGSTIKNLKVTDSLYDVDGDTDVRYVGSIIGYNRSNLDTLYSDVEILCDGQDIGGIAGYMSFHEATTQQSINNLWFNGSISGDTGRRMGGITGAIYGNEKNTPTYIFQNCLNSGTISNTRVDSKDGFGGQYIGGILGKEANPTIVVFKDCLNSGTINVTYKTYVGNVVGRMETAATVYTMNNVYMITDAFAVPYGESKATINGHIYKFTKSALSGAGGYQWTNLDFEKYWIAVTDSTPVLKSFVADASVNVVDVTKVAKPIDTKWYDNNPNASTFEIKTREELYGLWSLVANGNTFKGKEIDLLSDISINEEQNGSNPWFAIGSSGAPFAGTFDGNNHTISGIYIMESTAGDYQGLFAYTSKESMIQNLKVTDSYFEMKGNRSQQYIGGIVAYAEGSLKNLYSDVDIVTDGVKLGGIVGALDYTKEMTGRVLENCWFAGSITGEKARQSGGIVGTVIGNSKNDVNYTIKTCLFTGYIGNDRVPKSGDGCGGQYIGSMLGFDSGKAHITVTNCLGAGTLKSQYGTYMGSVIGRLENKNSTLKIENSYVTNELFNGKAVGEAVNTEAVSGDATKVALSALYGYGALTAIDLDYEQEWSAVLGSVPMPQPLLNSTHQVATLNTKWYYDAKKDDKNNEPGTTENPYKINGANDFYGLAKLVNEEGQDFNGKTVILTDNIYLNEGDVHTSDGLSDWTPISSFAGTLDGQGHMISGMRIGASANRGMFTKITGKVGNFTLSNSTVVANHNSGAIVGELNGELHNVYVDDTVVVQHHQKQNVGGIVGNVETNGIAKISNCSFAGIVKWSQNSAPTAGGHAGIVGRMRGKICEIINCEMSGTVEKGYIVGGLVGNIQSGSVTLRNCLVTGTVSSARDNVATVDTLVGSNAGTIYVEDVYSAGTNSGVVLDSGTKAAVSDNVMDGIGSNGSTKYIYGLTSEVAQEEITGSAAWDKLNLDFYSKYNEDGVWVAIDGGLPKLKIAVTEADTVLEEDYTGTTNRFGWYYLHTKSTLGAAATTAVTPATGTVFQIETVGDMYGLSNLVNSSSVTFSGHTVELCNDLIFNPNWNGTIENAPTDHNWAGIGAVSFAGTFDGKNHTISKVYQNRAGNHGGLFRRVSGTLQNLIISDSSFYSEKYYIAGAVGHLTGTMDNVHLDAGVTVYGGSNSYHVGGLTSYVNSTTTINNCSFAGTVIGGFSTRGTGGLVGTVEETNAGTVTISNCAFTGTLNGTKPAGGILGMIRTVTGKQLDVNVTDCVVSGTVTLTETSSQWGAVCGRLEPNTKITLTRVNTSSCNRTERCASPDGTVVDNDK